MIAALLDYLVLALRATFWVVAVGLSLGWSAFLVLAAFSGAGEGSEEREDAS